MEQLRRKPLMNEKEAAEYLGILPSTLRDYASTRIIPCIIKVLPRKSRGKAGYAYEFSLEALDAYDQKRRRGPRYAASYRALTDEQIVWHLNADLLTLRETADIAGVSTERVRQIGKKLGVQDAAIRSHRRKEEKNKGENQRVWDEFLENRPPWYRAFEDQCARPERGIIFKPYTFYRRTRLRFSYKKASCNGYIVHLHHATFQFFVGNKVGYACLHVYHPIPNDCFVGVVGMKKQDSGENFCFWIIPGVVINGWREQYGAFLYLAPRREVKKRYGLEGREQTHSPWAEWYERWDLLAPVSR